MGLLQPPQGSLRLSRGFGRLAAVVAIGASLTACGSSSGLGKIAPDQRLAYKRQQEAAENLEIPPDLTTAHFDDALDLPSSVTGSATLSELEGQRSRRQAVAVDTAVLPQVDGIDLRRDGGDRWLTAAAPPQQVWPRIIAFWREQGILLAEQDPTTGTMRTDWLENRIEIRKDFVTNVIRKFADGLYSTSTRDQYRVRLEPGVGRDSTEIYLTHRGMTERLLKDVTGNPTNTVWEPSGSDPDKEAEMLRRLMVFLGASDQGAQRMLAADTGKPSLSRLITADGIPTLIIGEEPRRAWRMTSLALDRSGFAVEDQDYSRGLFFVRYDDTDRTAQKQGVLSKLAFWRSDDANDEVANYQLKLEGRDNETRVTIRDAAGQADRSETAERILSLVQEEIR